MLTLHEKVVYPGIGTAQISRIVEKKVGGATVCFYELSFLNQEMTILVPIDSLASVGIRTLSSCDAIQTMFKLLAQPNHKAPYELASSNWNKRHKDYQCKIRTGSIDEIGKIYKDLRYIATFKELSFGEKNILTQTEMLLAEEIGLVIQVSTDKAIERLRSFFDTPVENITVNKTSASNNAISM